jgi:hypothetical protein
MLPFSTLLGTHNWLSLEESRLRAVLGGIGLGVSLLHDFAWLPQRLLSEPLLSGLARGASLTPPELREMIQGYYRAREWDEDGFIPEEKLNELGIRTLSSRLLKAE